MQQNDGKPPELKVEKAKGGGSGGRAGQTAVETGSGDDRSASKPPEPGSSILDLALYVVEEIFLKLHGGANWQQAWPEAEACANGLLSKTCGEGVSLDLVASAIDQVISAYTVQEFTGCGVDELGIMYPFINREYLVSVCKLVKVYGKPQPPPKA